MKNSKDLRKLVLATKSKISKDKINEKNKKKEKELIRLINVKNHITKSLNNIYINLEERIKNNEFIEINGHFRIYATPTNDPALGYFKEYYTSMDDAKILQKHINNLNDSKRFGDVIAKCEIKHINQKLSNCNMVFYFEI